MPYTTPPTFSNGNILTAAQLNILSDDIEFLYGLTGGGINTPFNSLRLTDTNARSTNNSWLLKHQHQYLHHQMSVDSGDNTEAFIFITLGLNDIQVYRYEGTETGAFTYPGGAIDLEDLTTWVTTASGDTSIYQGGWAVSTAYNQYEIVNNGGSPNYYYCKQSHTSSASDEPGVGASWTTYWSDLGTNVNLWTTGTRYQMYVYTTRSGSYQFTVDYLLESDQSTL